jgi:hypothetical protein
MPGVCAEVVPVLMVQRLVAKQYPSVLAFFEPNPQSSTTSENGSIRERIAAPIRGTTLPP